MKRLTILGGSVEGVKEVVVDGGGVRVVAGGGGGGGTVSASSFLDPNLRSATRSTFRFTYKLFIHVKL